MQWPVDRLSFWGAVFEQNVLGERGDAFHGSRGAHGSAGNKTHGDRRTEDSFDSFPRREKFIFILGVGVGAMRPPGARSSRMHTYPVDLSASVSVYASLRRSTG